MHNDKNANMKPSLELVLLSFYECLTDPNHLETLLEVLTSWLDDGDGQIVAPKIDRHAEKIWGLLGEISESEFQKTGALEGFVHRRFEKASEVETTLLDQVEPEDIAKLRSWLASDTQTNALLLRVTQEDATELVVLSRDARNNTYSFKRSGPKFQKLLSQFVAESFDLTHAEISLVQELLAGGTLREIADRLGKSWETTRSQVKTLTNKLGVSSQADILRVVHKAAMLKPAAPAKPSAQEDKHRTLVRPDGRTLAYDIDGPKSDRTMVYLHGMFQGRHWPEKARKYAIGRGWRVIRISRAGCGHSDVNPKTRDALLQDHVDDLMAVINHEKIDTFSIFGAADGFSVGYAAAMQHPERIKMIVGLEALPPILSHKDVSGFVGKMKTYGLACLYAPKTIKLILGIAMRSLTRSADPYSGIHPLLGVELSKIEDADGIRAHDRNFRDLIDFNAEGMWRDSSFSNFDWAYAPNNTNRRPRVALIHCEDSLVKSSGFLDDFAERIGAPIYQIESYLPYISSPLPLVLSKLEAP